MIKLHFLARSPDRLFLKKRVGRGSGSGCGKTSGRGQKGQKSRSGVSLGGFEGGQNPLYRRLPKRGFRNIFAKKVVTVNLSRLQSAVDRGKIAVDQVVTLDLLQRLGLVAKERDAVRVLGKFSLKQPLRLQLDQYSKGARESLKRAGCEIIESKSKKNE